MSGTHGTGDTFETVFDAAEATAFVYRSIHAGICGSMTTAVPAADRTAAEAEALRHGLLRSGAWATTANGYDHAPAARTTV